jgi:hypothetical protein
VIANAKHNRDFKAWKPMLAAIQAVCVLMIWAELEIKIVSYTGKSRVVRRSVSPFVSNSIESVAQFEHGGFKFERAQYQWRELVVKKKATS